MPGVTVDWEAVSAFAAWGGLILAGVAGWYTHKAYVTSQKAYEISRSQRQIENSFKFNELFDKAIDEQIIIKEHDDYGISKTCTRNVETTWRKLLHDEFFAWVNSSTIDQSGKLKFGHGYDENYGLESSTFQKPLELLDLICASITEETANIKVIFNHLGFYLLLLYRFYEGRSAEQEMEKAYPSFYAFMNRWEPEIKNWTFRRYMTELDYPFGMTTNTPPVS